MYGYRFLSQGCADRREILHGGSATSQTCFLLFWEDSARDGRVLGVSMGHVAGYASCCSTCFRSSSNSRKYHWCHSYNQNLQSMHFRRGV